MRCKKGIVFPCTCLAAILEQEFRMEALDMRQKDSKKKCEKNTKRNTIRNTNKKYKKEEKSIVKSLTRLRVWKRRLAGKADVKGYVNYI